jgi:hypothetical protein
MLWCGALFLLLTAVILPTSAFANMAAPYLEADVLGEWASRATSGRIRPLRDFQLLPFSTYAN